MGERGPRGTPQAISRFDGPPAGCILARYLVTVSAEWLRTAWLERWNTSVRYSSVAYASSSFHGRKRARIGLPAVVEEGL